MTTIKKPSSSTTLRDFLRYAVTCFERAEIFYGHGTNNSFDEAMFLLFDSLSLPYEHAQDLLDARLTEDESHLLLQRLSSRVNERIPTAYLVKQAWFAGIPFYVDERVLIPRSPIAELIEAQFAPWIEPSSVKRVCDMCAGSACIAIATALYMPGVVVDAVEYNDEAIEVANQNVQKHRVGGQVNVMQSDLFDRVNATYDIIVANPPYVDKIEMASLPPEYEHEPVDALASGDDGLVHTHKLLEQAPKHLNDDGILIVEVGASRVAMEAAYPNLALTWLDFQRGGDGVFLVTKEALLAK